MSNKKEPEVCYEIELKQRVLQPTTEERFFPQYFDTDCWMPYKDEHYGHIEFNNPEDAIRFCKENKKTKEIFIINKVIWES